MRHQMSSGFGTQHNDSRDEPNYGGESIELRTICPTNSTETDPEAPLLQRTDSEQDNDAYMAYQKSLLARSPSYRKSVDRLSLLSSMSSDDDDLGNEISPEGTVKKLTGSSESNRVFKTSSQTMHDAPRPPLPCEEEFFRKCTNHRKQSPRNILRGVSDQSITTLSTDQDEFITRQSNLRDELLNCEKKELFQFLSEDFDTSNNYFSDTVGYSNAILDADTDSLVLDASLADRSREENYPVPNATPPRKTSSSSIRSNFSYISNSIFAALEQRRGGSISESIDRMLTRSVSNTRFNSDMDDREPLVSDSEFENIIASFEKELHEIKKSTPSLHRNLSSSSEERSNQFNTSIAVVSPRREHRRSSSNTYVPADQDVILARRAHTLGSANTNSESVQLKRRSLEKQSNIDDGFSVSNEIRKICDHMHAPFNAERLSGKPVSPSGVSPNMRRKTEFHNSFDRIKRTSLIERVDEVTDEDTLERQPARVVSEKLPRKMLSVELKLDSISLKSTGSYENLISNRDPRQYHTKQLDKFPDRIPEPNQNDKKSNTKSPKKSPKKGNIF